MKTTTKNLLTIAFLSIVCLTSCKKETIHKSNTELLTQKTWKFETHGLDENNNGIIEESETDMQPCEADDEFTFNANGTGLYTNGTLICNSGDPSTIDFNWLFANNETELAIFASPEKINKLDDNTLETYYEDLNSQGQTVKYIRRFKHY